MRHSLRHLGSALGAAVLLVLAGCGNNAADTGATDREVVTALPAGLKLAGASGSPAAKPLKQSTTIKVGVPAKSEGIAPLLLGDVLGEFEAENLKVELVQDTAPNLLTLLGQNKLDVVYAAPNALVLNAHKQGVDISWAGGLVANWPDSGLYLRPEFRSGAGSFDTTKLKGATIGVYPGGLSAPVSYPIYQALTQAGLTGKDIKLTTISDPATMQQALLDGSIDGAISQPPQAASVIKSGAFLAVPYTSDISIGGYFVGSRLLSDERDAGVAFFRAMLRTINTHLSGDYHQDADVVAALARVTGSQPEMITASDPYEFSLDVKPGSVEAMQEMYRALAPASLSFKGTLSQDDLVDLSLLVEAAKGK